MLRHEMIVMLSPHPGDRASIDPIGRMQKMSKRGRLSLTIALRLGVRAEYRRGVTNLHMPSFASLEDIWRWLLTVPKEDPRLAPSLSLVLRRMSCPTRLQTRFRIATPVFDYVSPSHAVVGCTSKVVIYTIEPGVFLGDGWESRQLVDILGLSWFYTNIPALPATETPRSNWCPLPQV